MVKDTKPNLNSQKFKQCATDVMNLSGCTQIYGKLDFEVGSTLTICDNIGAGKVLTSDASGVGTWQVPTSGDISGATNGLSIDSTDVVLGGTIDRNTSIELPVAGSGDTLSVSIGYSGESQIYVESGDDGSIELNDGDNAVLINSTGVIIASCIQGAVYAGDYEPNFVARSLVTKQYVDSAVPTGSTASFDSHTGDSTIHYVQSTITITESQVTNLSTDLLSKADLTGATFTGLVETTSIKITSGASDGFVLTSDASGNGTWVEVTGGTGGGIPYTGATEAVDLGSQTLTTTGTINGTTINIPTTNSNFFGIDAGTDATSAEYSNFLGNNAGCAATNACDSNFFGHYAGYGAYNACDSNFFGDHAGYGAYNAFDSNFFGNYAGGYGAYNACNSNFFGNRAGNYGTNAEHSNFFGDHAGNYAINAKNSNFFGYYAGDHAANANNSNFFGNNVGRCFGANNVGANNIIVGTNISLPNACADMINLGGVLFGTNTYDIITGDPSISGQTTGKVGVGRIPTTSTLEINGDSEHFGDGCGIILRSPDSTAYCVTVANGGTITVTAV